jgi:hypothetical protein
LVCSLFLIHEDGGRVRANEWKGLCAGLVVSTFSRSLALILGLLVVGVQVSFNGSRKEDERERKKVLMKAVGIQLRHPHHPLQPTSKIRHKHRPPFRSARQRRIQALIRHHLRISSFHAVLGKTRVYEIPINAFLPSRAMLLHLTPSPRLPLLMYVGMSLERDCLSLQPFHC